MEYANGCRCAACARRSYQFPARLSSNKDVREEVRALRRLGFDYTGPDSSGHHHFAHPSHGEITVAGSPSVHHWRKRHRHRLARLMGLNRWQLERLIAGQPLQSTARPTGPGRISNEAIVMEHAMALGIPCNKLTAKRLLSRFGSVRDARTALDGMVRAVQRQAA
jgi:hypothetical protein